MRTVRSDRRRTEHCAAPRIAAVIALMAAAVVPAHAQAPREDDLRACAALERDADRLACFDRLVPRARPAPDTASATGGGATAAADPAAGTRRIATEAARPADAQPAASHFGALWSLDVPEGATLFDIRPHQPTYLLPARWSDRPNSFPRSPTRGDAPAVAVRAVEAAFQVSFKVKAADLSDWMPGGMRAGLWGAYTQKSHWQVYNADLSRPFRETNYEPELIFAAHPDWPLGAARVRLLAVSFTHQSNGRANPLSRSWNRVIATAGVEHGPLALTLRGWARVRERNEDDNPDLTRYLGHGDVSVDWRAGAQRFGITGRLNPGSSKGAVQARWSFPLARRVRGEVQAFSGYGETLIDYNWKQTTVGLGISLDDRR